jgi:hypothetical protein
MDVIAGRKTQGEIRGEILVNGFPKEQRSWARVVGYVEQTDIHTPQVLGGLPRTPTLRVASIDLSCSWLPHLACRCSHPPAATWLTHASNPHACAFAALHAVCVGPQAYQPQDECMVKVQGRLHLLEIQGYFLMNCLQATVKEAVLFSARMRLAESVPRAKVLHLSPPPHMLASPNIKCLEIRRCQSSC